VIDAVLVDLDDTLFDQFDWLRGAFAAVAADAAARHAIDEAGLREAMLAIAARGSAAGRIIDRGLDAVGATGIAVGPLVDAFRSHRDGSLRPYPGVCDALAALGDLVPLGLVTDGDPGIQEGKIEDLGIGGHFRAVVISDRLGRAYRKPHPAPFRSALDRLGVAAVQAAFVGDHPTKDVAGAAGLGMFTVRVRTGEHRHADGPLPPSWDVADAVTAFTDLTTAIRAARARAPAAGA
jgi:putative hydrolase of the HAD superfamily